MFRQRRITYIFHNIWKIKSFLLKTPLWKAIYIFKFDNTFNRGTQRLVSLNYMFGEANILPRIFFCLTTRHRRTGNFLPGGGGGGAVNHLPKNYCKLPQILQNSRKETRVMQQNRPYWHMKVARYSFSELIPAKFEHKVHRHKQAFGKNCHHSCIR